MTAISKEKKDNIINNGFRTVVIALLSTIIIGGGKYLSDLQSKTFSSVELRVKTEELANNAPTHEKMKEWDHHINAKGVHMPKEAKDSVYVTRAEFNEIIRNNAIDQYDMKKSMQRGFEKTTEHNVRVERILRALEYKLDKLENKNSNN